MVTSRAGPQVIVVGAGPAGLMAAEICAAGGAAVTIYERMASPGRKFLLAGRGGLNLTHGEPPDAFRARYDARADRLAPYLATFDAAALRAWCADLGIETFVGSSGRVFPRAMKSSPLLRAWLRRLDGAGVRLLTRRLWCGWDDHGRPVFEVDGERHAVDADALVLACGGASWPHLGSDGGWAPALEAAGCPVAPLRPANCGFEVAWSEHLRHRFEGTPLKNVALTFEGRVARGDLVITRAGLEGGALYALAAPLREALARHAPAVLEIALRPDLAPADIAARLARRTAGQSLSTALRKTLALAPQAIALLRETTPDLAALAPDALAARINAVPLPLLAPAPIARAISSAGGVPFEALDPALMLAARPGTFCAGEMLDWEAPTGGYLLQACFATGRAAGIGALDWVRRNEIGAPARSAAAP